MKNVIILTVVLHFSITAYADVVGNNIISGLIKAAKERTMHNVTYDGSYFSISYPNGDIPSNIGVCTDLVIRSFR